MKKLSELKIAKNAILSKSETSLTGGTQVGSGTNYSGPDNPTYIETIVDGNSIGQDQTIGNAFGDSWNITLSPQGDTKTGVGQISVN